MDKRYNKLVDIINNEIYKQCNLKFKDCLVQTDLPVNKNDAIKISPRFEICKNEWLDKGVPIVTFDALKVLENSRQLEECIERVIHFIEKQNIKVKRINYYLYNCCFYEDKDNNTAMLSFDLILVIRDKNPFDVDFRQECIDLT